MCYTGENGSHLLSNGLDVEVEFILVEKVPISQILGIINAAFII
jgi:hypothetical protein